MLEDLLYFQRRLPDDLAKVSAVINRVIQSDAALISQIGTYITDAGDKRLRPIIAILVGKAVGHNNEKLYSLAAMMELIHTSTPLHDNVADENELRRGHKTTNNPFGDAAAVLIGDFLYTRAFQLMASSGSMRVLEVMADATDTIVEGEVIQLMNIGDTDITGGQYIQAIQYKTVKSFGAAARVGAILGKASLEHEQALRGYSTYIGTAFQVIDDILDHSGRTKEVGRDVGDDLAGGKPALPSIYLVQNSSKQTANDACHALKNADRSYLEKTHDYVVNSNTLPRSTSGIKKAVDKAIASLDVLPDSEVKETMIQLAKESLARVF